MNSYYYEQWLQRSVLVNPLRRDNPANIMTTDIAGSQVTLCGEWCLVCPGFINVCNVNLGKQYFLISKDGDRFDVKWSHEFLPACRSDDRTRSS